MMSLIREKWTVTKHKITTTGWSAVGWLGRNLFYLVALGFALAHAVKLAVVDWPVVILLIVAGFPQWFPLLARNIKSIRKTDKGWELDTHQSQISLGSAEPNRGISARSPLDDMSPQARLVLSTLWHFQVEKIGEDDPGRWGFKVVSGAGDYASFAIGANELWRLKYLYRERTSIACLTDEGMEFCRRNKEALAREPFIRGPFSSV
jgi:hypothetical protein